MAEVEPAATSPGGDGPDGERDRDEQVMCPWCGGANVERMAMYGPQMMADQYRCRDCLNFFGRVLKR